MIDKEIDKEIENNEDITTLLCPKCSGFKLHHFKTEIQNGVKMFFWCGDCDSISSLSIEQHKDGMTELSQKSGYALDVTE